MNTKLQQWLALQRESTQHLNNAGAALAAVDHTVDKVVNRHLMRIFRTEQDLAEFAEIISNSKAFQEEE